MQFLSLGMPQKSAQPHSSNHLRMSFRNNSSKDSATVYVVATAAAADAVFVGIAAGVTVMSGLAE